MTDILSANVLLALLIQMKSILQLSPFKIKQ